MLPRLGDNVAHEAGHDFGLQHIYDTQNSRSVKLANSENMGYGLNLDAVRKIFSLSIAVRLYFEQHNLPLTCCDVI